MTDRSTFDAFEQRIASELGRYVAPATDPKPASEIAGAAMRPRGLVVRARNLSRSRRFLLFGLAATLTLPAAYLGALSNRPPAPDPLTEGYVSIFVRRDEGPEPGVSVFAVRPDGGEALVRHVPDSVVPVGETLREWQATVSETGWLALGTELNGSPWPMVLIDLADVNAEPWLIPEANTGGVGPRWGPTGLLAANAGSLGHLLVIVDPETHSTRTVSTRGGMVGGGPSIIWTPDGSGIAAETGTGLYEYETVPIDGSAASPGVGEVFDARGEFGRGLAQLRICEPGTNCPGGDDGRVDRVELDGSTRTIWQQSGGDRALAARFLGGADEYWLTTDHDSGRQVALIHLKDGRQEVVAIVNRDARWQSVATAGEAPDQSMVLVWTYVDDQPAAVVVPTSGARQTFHRGQFAGFVDSATSAVFATGHYVAPAETMPDAGEAYRLPPLDELIAVELARAPSHVVLGKASHDAVQGDTSVRTFEVARDLPGAGNVYLDCSGPSNVTVMAGSQSATSPCLQAGTYQFLIDASSPIIVTASGDTSWRVVIWTF